MLVEARTSDAELESLQEDVEYKRRREAALEQEAILKAMHPSRETMSQVDQLICSINDYWSRKNNMKKASERV